MTDSDMTGADPLNAFFRAGEAPAADARFRLAVMEKVALRRFRVDLALRLLAAALLLIGAVLLAPVLDGIAAALGGTLYDLFLVLGVAGLIAFAGHAWLTRTIRWPALRLF
ncbi:hypothetical protein [Maricaulis sp.]|uniref:hypothetical protein n=1 Tax=Maricaulis sp. TaxID=1486257 RepID=UPI002612C6BD|nr:hypothetical protein [Maricaulis sp.]